MEDSKRKILEFCTFHGMYLDLYQTGLDDDVERTIEVLKNQYISSFQTPVVSLLVSKEEKEEIAHSKQSEIFGKLMMLVHEFKGYKGVQELITELQWKMQELVVEQLERYEKTIEELKGGK